MANYVVTVGSDDNSLVIIDVTDPSSPFIAATLAGSGAPPYIGEAWDIGVSEDRRRVWIGNNLDARLTTIDIEDPTAPFYVTSIDLTSLPSPEFFPVAMASQGFKMAVFGMAGITFFDLIPNYVPTYKSNLTHVDMMFVVAMRMRTNELYALDESGIFFSINTLDIEHPLISDVLYDLAGVGTASYFDIEGDYAYVGCESENNSSTRIAVIDISDPSNLVLVGVYTINLLGVYSGGMLLGIHVKDGHLYGIIPIGEGGMYMYIFDISVTPPTLTGHIWSTGGSIPPDCWLQGGYNMILNSNHTHGYIASFYDRVVSIDITDPSTPFVVAKVDGIHYPFATFFMAMAYFTGIGPPPVVLPTVQTLPATDVL